MLLREALRHALLLNELSGNANAAYRFSQAEGGTSGLSFGLTQLDLNNNQAASQCLKECGFTGGEIMDLKNKTADHHALSAKLVAHKEVIDRYDGLQLDSCLDHVMNVAKSRRLTFANDEAVIHLADYHNQYYLSTAGKMSIALASLGRPVTAKDILEVKLDTTWGKTHPADVKRRYNNIARLMGGATLIN